jgi:SET domain-containing protein
MDNTIRLDFSDTLNGIRCVKANRDIKKGEVVEEVPVIILPDAEAEHAYHTVLARYLFIWDDESDAVLLGYGSIYNHSFSPNLDFAPDKKRNLMVFTATKDIKKDEELLINYQQGANDDDLGEEYTDFRY